MKKILIPLFLLIASVAFGQTHYNPSKGSVSNTPFSPAQGYSTDGRSQFLFDSFPYYTYRDYKSTTEVNTYLYLSKFRTGGFSVFIHNGGTLNANGTYTGGTRDEYWYKNGTADSNLVIKQTTVSIDSLRTDSSIVVLNAAGTPATFKRADTTGKAGVVAVPDMKKIQRQDVALSYAELRALTTPVPGHFYRALINGMYRDFVWDASNTTTDDSVMVLKLAGVTTGRLIQYYTNDIYVDWFGTAHDGSTDDTYKIQKAINFAVKVSTINHAANLIFGGYIYICNKAIIYKITSTEYDFVALNISGPTPTHDDGEALGAITVLKTTQLDGFVMGVQKGRNIKISNITFYGPMTTLPNPAQTFTWTNAQWLVSGLRNNAKSPQCLFTIDPFYYSVLTADQYPGMASWYGNTQAGGTSQLTFDGCTMRYSNVGLAVSTNSFTQNAENIVYENGSMYGCRIFWASGQAQSRTNKIVNAYCLGAVQYFINCNDYGNNQGSPPNMYDCNLAGSVKYVYLFNGQFSGMSIFGGDMESLYSLGVSGGRPVNITNAHITLMRPEVELTFVSPIFAEGSTINFYGGSIEHFDGDGIDNFRFNMDQVNIFGTTFVGGPPINSKAGKLNTIQFYGCELKTNGLSSTLNEHSTTYQSNESVFNGSQFIPGMSVTTDNGGDLTGKFTYTSVDNKFEFIPMTTETLHIDSTTWTAYFLTTNIAKYQQFDLLFSGTVDDTNDIFTGVSTTIGYITRLSNNSGTAHDTVFIKNPPAGLTNNASYILQVYRIPTFEGRVLGNTHSGTTTIDGVTFEGVNIAPGSKIKGVGIPVGTYVVSRTSTTITTSQPSTATNTGVALYDAKLHVYSYSVYPTVYFKDDEFRQNGSGDDTTYYKWICVIPGNQGTGTPYPAFKQVAYASSASSQWTTSGSDIYNANAGSVGVGTTTFTDPIVGVSKFQAKDGTMIMSFKDLGGFPGQGYLAISNGTMTGYVGHTNTTNGFTLGSSTNHNFALVANNVLVISGKPTGKVQFPAYTTALPLDTTNKKLLVRDAFGNVESMNWPIGGYSIQTIRDSLQLDTTWHSRDVSYNTATPFNVDTINFTNFSTGLELIRITCEMMVSKSTGESYTSTRTKWYKILNGTVLDGDSTNTGDQYLPTGGTTTRFYITRAGGLMLIYMVPESGTFTGSITYQVKRKKG